jgi:hypothetical protein
MAHFVVVLQLATIHHIAQITACPQLKVIIAFSFP